jgi:glycosyltransferase involved in cell wall biosynthesis
LLKNRVVYLSGSPRVSTRPTAEMVGPKTHVLGVIKGFKNLHWQVETFIVGDRVPLAWISKGSEKSLSGNPFLAFASDLIRLFIGYINAHKVYKQYGSEVNCVYERFGLFQALGRVFKSHGVPWILETNALLSDESKNQRKTVVLGRLARFFEKKAYENCDILVCISDTLKKIIISELNIPKEKIIVIPNGVDTDLIHPNNYVAKRLFSNFTIGFVGSLYPWSGLDLLIKAIGRLQHKGLEICLTVVGDGLMRDEWQALAKALGLEEKVNFLGKLPWEDVPQYIAGFDICYSGQINFGQGSMYLSPLKLYEYMAMAKPVIASAFEDAQSTIEHGNTGFLYSPGDQIDLEKVLTEVYSHKETLPNMGLKARKNVENNHTWTVRVAKIIEAINQIKSSEDH